MRRINKTQGIGVRAVDKFKIGIRGQSGGEKREQNLKVIAIIYLLLSLCSHMHTLAFLQTHRVSDLEKNPAGSVIRTRKRLQGQYDKDRTHLQS